MSYFSFIKFWIRNEVEVIIILIILFLYDLFKLKTILFYWISLLFIIKRLKFVIDWIHLSVQINFIILLCIYTLTERKCVSTTSRKMIWVWITIHWDLFLFWSVLLLMLVYYFNRYFLTAFHFLPYFLLELFFTFLKCWWLFFKTKWFKFWLRWLILCSLWWFQVSR
jgi:hypothetical protein